MISVTIVIKNGEKTIQQVLSSLTQFEQILLFDTGSTDRTIEIAQQFPNVTIHKKTFEGFGKAHNQAASLARHNWILSIDADEILSPKLIEEFQNFKPQKGHVYSLPFQNFYRGKRVYIWDPEEHIRLYNRNETSFTEAQVHEGVKVEGLNISRFVHPVFHHSYSSVSDFLIKMERYTNLFAEQSKKRATPWTALFHGSFAFLKYYIFKRGFLGGYRGFLISAYIGHTAFYKYMKLYEAQC
ncbi:MAG: hypothetical protein S4CHLAM81_14530 [Chlamydiales bacterium]|nr:hypothetical protein [Chlamydiales bacterium]MCH9636225.1 hypothetical protein [Chlamydiales bacterium]